MTTDEHDRITAGQLVMLTEGAYSDFHVVGLFRAERDFNMRTEMQKWRAKINPEGYRYADELGAFAASLSERGYLKDVEYSEQDLGAYNVFDRLGGMYSMPMRPSEYAR